MLRSIVYRGYIQRPGVLIPLIVAEFLMERERTGVELYNFLAAEAAKDNPMFTNGNHTLMMDWAVVSRQKNQSTRSSVLALDIRGIACAAPEFTEWNNLRWNCTLGQ